MEIIKKQLEFIEWLKSKGLYNSMDNAYIMEKMQAVWQALKDDHSVSFGGNITGTG